MHKEYKNDALLLLTGVARINKLMDDLEWERDRMSSSGQETLDKYWLLIEDLNVKLQKLQKER